MMKASRAATCPLDFDEDFHVAPATLTTALVSGIPSPAAISCASAGLGVAVDQLDGSVLGLTSDASPRACWRQCSAYRDTLTVAFRRAEVISMRWRPLGNPLHRVFCLRFQYFRYNFLMAAFPSAVTLNFHPQRPRPFPLPPPRGRATARAGGASGAVPFDHGAEALHPASRIFPQYQIVGRRGPVVASACRLFLAAESQRPALVAVIHIPTQAITVLPRLTWAAR